MRRPLEFSSVEEAVSILGHHRLEARLRAMEASGFFLEEYKQQELADFIKASRERVSTALLRMGKCRRSNKHCGCGQPIAADKVICNECADAL